MNIKNYASAVVKHASYNIISVNLKLDFVFHSPNTFNRVFYNQSQCGGEGFTKKGFVFQLFEMNFCVVVVFCLFFFLGGMVVFVISSLFVCV